ncbi:MAG TPA: NAD(P)H-binding protein [Bacteroidia bacterium]|nr:NAD(P)H-binding protein [Bacteroidia bacterium]
MKSAIIFGASGLTGHILLEKLLLDHRYEKIKIFVRRSVDLVHPKLEQVIIDYDRFYDYRSQIIADEVFCCLGTTIKAAGSRYAFRKVDYERVKMCAEMASVNKVKTFIVISSLNANAASKNFYYRTKGEMENAVRALPFEKCIILRPSLLLGSRNEFRFGEMLGKIGMIAFSFLLREHYKPVKAAVVADAMIRAANDPHTKGVLENEDIRKLGA